VAQAVLTRTLSRRLSVAASGALGAAVAVVTAGFYFIDAGRPLDYDSSLTVGAFVKTGSLLDPLRRQIQLNNHPLFSVLEHVVWSSGLHSETALRVLPILFGVLTVGLIAAWCAHLWGPLAGVSAGAIVAANPMFAELSRGVRGYSLLAFCALVATLLFWQLLTTTSVTTTHRTVQTFYVLFLAAGISTHLYGCTVVVVHAAIVLARRQFGATWIGRWLIAGFLGSLIYAKTVNNVLNTHNQRQFHGTFAREFTLAILGQARLAAALLAVMLAVALWLARRRIELVTGFATIVAFVLFVWLVLQPEFLVVRYWAWIIPGVGLAAAFLVARRPVVVVLVLVAVVAMAAHDRPLWRAVQHPTSEAAAVVDAGRALGMDVCGYHHTGVAVLAYTRQPKTRAETIDQMANCDLVIGFYVPAAIDRVERRTFPYSWSIPGITPARVYSRRPKAEITAAMPRRRLDLETHRITFPS
jgi:hypothetical protein